MSKVNGRVIVLAACIVAIVAVCAFGQDWPQWRGMNRDAKVAGFKAPDTWPKELTQKWKVTVGEGDSTPDLVDDRLYVFARQGDEEVISCLNAGDGSEIWSDKYEVPAIPPPSGREHSGPRSSPVVSDVKIVTHGVTGILSCLDASDGKVLWRKDLFPGAWPRFYTASSPLIVDGMAVAHLGGESNGGIVALDLATGDEKWKWTGDGPAYSSPVLMTVDGTKQIVEMTDKNIVGVSVADGSLLWKVAFMPEGRSYNAATPIVDGQTVIYTGAGRGTKAIKIEKQGDGFVTQELWSNDELNPQFTTPVLKDNLLFGMSNRGNLYCLNAKNGESEWVADEQLNRRGFCAIIDVGSFLFALSGDADLIIYKPGSEQFSEVARYKVSESSVYAYPIVSGNRIFIKDRDSLILWTVE